MIIVPDTTVLLSPLFEKTHSLCVMAGQRVKTLCGHRVSSFEAPVFAEGQPTCKRCCEILARPAHIQSPTKKQTLCGKQIKSIWRFAFSPAEGVVCKACVRIFEAVE